MSDRRLAVIGILAFFAAACGLADPTPSLAPGESVQAEDPECRPIDILGPSGTGVVLTGVWRSNDFGVYDLHQTGSCLYWLGMSQYSGEEPGSSWTTVFSGILQSDFTIVGRWADVPFNPDIPADSLGRGTMTLRIGFDQSGEVERPVLRVANVTGGFGGSAWVLEESLAPAIELDGTFGGNVDPLFQTGCAWIESNGQRYELIGGEGWEVRGDSPLRLEDGRGHVIARVDDPLRIRGRVSEALGTNCVETAILVEELGPP
ncbi:MAG: hypothetical protein AABM41_08365 [Chloroflexota bacterium]